MASYKSRVIDVTIVNRLRNKGAILVEGAKWCGKTTTCEQHASSILYMSDPDRVKQNLQLADISPRSLLQGETPRLIDEWQMAPKLWDAVRFEVDHRDGFGHFLLTGSAVPAEMEQVHHTGTGRFAWIKMRPMSLYESGESSGAVSLSELFSPDDKPIFAENKATLENIAFLICRGGWPQATFLEGDDALVQAFDYFKMYVMAFADSSDAKNLLKTKAYQQKSAGEQAAAYLERLYSYAYSIEREKLFYFSLVYQQTTVIITAPADNKAQKEFLGYDWSNRKGNEGIQIITPGGKMYDDADRVAQGTLAHSIKKSFDGMAPSFNEEQATYASVVNTKNMLDYSRVNFNKALRTSVKKAFHISSKYPLVKLASVCDLNTSKTEIHDTPDDLLVSFIDMASVSSEGFIERKVDCPYGEVRNGGYTYFAEGDFIIAKITPCMENGKCAIAEGLTNGIGFGSSEFHTFRCHASEILTKFLFLLLNQTTVRKAAEDAMTGASGHRRVPAAFYEEMLIPVPPIPVQQQVIDECAKIDEEYNATRMSIETYRQKTADLFAELDAVMSTTEGNRLSLSDTEKFSVAIGKRVLDKELASNGTIPVYSANVTAPFGFIDKLLITDFSAPSVLWRIDGDWMTSYLPSDMPFYPTDHCGVLRCKNSEVNPRYLAHILEVEGRKMGFSRSYRASIDRVHGIAFTVPDISIQNNAMSKVADYEMAIKELEGSLEKIDSRRSEIIRKALAE